MQQTIETTIMSAFVGMLLVFLLTLSFCVFRDGLENYKLIGEIRKNEIEYQKKYAELVKLRNGDK